MTPALMWAAMRAIFNVFNVTRSHGLFSLTLCSKNARICILMISSRTDQCLPNSYRLPTFRTVHNEIIVKNVVQYAIVSLNIFIHKTEQLKCNVFLYKNAHTKTMM